MIVIIDYGMGNLASVQKAFLRVGAEAKISSRVEDIRAARKIVFPGVGHFAEGMRQLSSRGLTEELSARVLQEKIPLLGICLGMQLLSSWGEEGDVSGLGWIAARTKRFQHANANSAAAQCRPSTRPLKVPHMGWNSVQTTRSHPLTASLPEDNSFYFAHSYHLTCEDNEDVLAWTTYGYPFPSIVQKANITAVQFHPEKSLHTGLKLLKNFAEEC